MKTFLRYWTIAVFGVFIFAALGLAIVLIVGWNPTMEETLQVFPRFLGLGMLAALTVLINIWTMETKYYPWK